MQIDERNPGKQYGDWNRAFLQFIMSRGFVSGQEVFRGAKEIYERFKSSPKFPSVRMDTGDTQDMADFIEWLTKMANANLEKENIPLRLKKTFEEVKLESEAQHAQYYCLVPESQDEAISKLQRNFGEPELEWLKLVAEHLIEEEEDSLATPNTLTNLCRNGGNNAGKKKLTVTEADRSMNVFIEEGYLQKVGSGKRQKIGLGPRFLAEMEGWLADEERPEGVWKCGKCDRVGMVGLNCNKRDCHTKFHSYHHGLQKCSRCKTPLTGTGEAVKRSK